MLSVTDKKQEMPIWNDHLGISMADDPQVADQKRVLIDPDPNSPWCKDDLSPEQRQLLEQTHVEVLSWSGRALNCVETVGCRSLADIQKVSDRQNEHRDISYHHPPYSPIGRWRRLLVFATKVKRKSLRTRTVFVLNQWEMAWA